jgi:hypothetical protein
VGALESAVAQAEASLVDQQLYLDLASKAAALGQFTSVSVTLRWKYFFCSTDPELIIS